MKTTSHSSLQLKQQNNACGVVDWANRERWCQTVAISDVVKGVMRISSQASVSLAPEAQLVHRFRDSDAGQSPDITVPSP